MFSAISQLCYNYDFFFFKLQITRLNKPTELEHKNQIVLQLQYKDQSSKRDKIQMNDYKNE